MFGDIQSSKMRQSEFVETIIREEVDAEWLKVIG